MLPNLLIIGAGKCGTTSLHAYLDAHPDIFMSHPKELNYFIRDDWREPHRRAWYESHFAQADGQAYRGESSPSYTSQPLVLRNPAERIHETIPQARMIYMVRDPFERLVSNWYQGRHKGGHPWEQYIAAWREPTNRPFCGSRYAMQLKQYLEHFPEERILVLDQEELLRDGERTLQGIFRWLGVDDAFTSSAFEEHRNTREGKGVPRAPRWMRRTVVNPLREKVPARVREPLLGPARKLLYKPIDERPAIEGRLREEMAEVLQPEVDWLRRYTGKKFETWSL